MRHVHGNPALVAASRVEEHVARQAARAVFLLRAGTKEPAERCAPLPPQVIRRVRMVREGGEG